MKPLVLRPALAVLLLMSLCFHSSLAATAEAQVQPSQPVTIDAAPSASPETATASQAAPAASPTTPADSPTSTSPEKATSASSADSSPATAVGTTGDPLTLHGEVITTDGLPTADTALDQLFGIAPQDDHLAGSSQTKFHANFHKLVYKSKSILNYIFDYRAFGPSTEGANFILDEHEKAKSLEAQAYQKQQKEDAKHLQIVTSIMQLGMGVGMRNSARAQKLIDSSMTCLRETVGDKQADAILATLQKYSKTASFPALLANQDFFDIQQRQKQVQKIVSSAVTSDTKVQEIRKSLHKYNGHSKLAIRATGVVQTALSIASFTPTFVAPAAETAFFILMLATGGPEQDKLLRELYLSKCIESRARVINDKANLALDTYHMAVLSENAVLLACTQSMVRQMTGDAAMKEVFGLLEAAQPAGASPVVARPEATVH